MSARLASLCAVVLWLGTFPTAVGAWPVEGVLLSTSCCARSALVVSDGAGGAIVAWQAGLEDVYAKRVTATGEIAPGWPPTGVPVCIEPTSQYVTSVAPDGQGGVVIAWEDFRNGYTGTTRVDIYAQRLQADGSLASGWAVDGMPVARPPGDQRRPVVAPDGSGGAFFSWYDEATLDIYVQHLSAGGEVAPGWPADGLPVCTLPGFQGLPLVIADGAGGVIVAWDDLRDGGNPADGPFAAYAQRVQANGTVAPGWPENGARIVFDRDMVALIPDGAGGGYLACGTLGEINAADYFLQRFTGEGTIAPGWPEGGSPVCLAPGDRAGLSGVLDGVGGVLLAWSDRRDYPSEVYLQRMRPDGSLQPGWPTDGLRVTNNSAFDDLVTPAADGLGGAFLAWDRVAGPLGKSQVFVHHVTAAPALDPGWPVHGQAVPGQLRTGSPAMIDDGAGGAIVVWEDSTRRLRALRYWPDGPVPVLVALVSAEAGWDHVRLTWQGAAAGLVAGIERRTNDADWERLASASADGSGRIVYEDRAVVAGARYAYRLAYQEGGELVYTTETWVELPLARFALHGAHPNPVVNDLVVAFSLLSAEPAWLELYDLAGRRIETREVGTLGPGPHRLAFTRGRRLPAGIYTLVLRQGERRAIARAVVLR